MTQKGDVYYEISAASTAKNGCGDVGFAVGLLLVLLLVLIRERGIFDVENRYKDKIYY